MKKNVILIIFVCIATIYNSYGQWGNSIALSKNITTETLDITDFQRISASDDFQVFIKFSDKAEKVVIEANENLHDYIIVKKEGDRLNIGTKGYSTSHKRSAKEKLIAYVTVRNLVAIYGDDDAEIQLEDKLEAKNFSIDLTDDAVLKGNLTVKNLKVELSDDAELSIAGSANTMDVDADSDSYIKGFDFVVEDLNIRLRGDSETKITVNGNINVIARGDSELTYMGDASFTRKSISDDSDIRHKRK